MKKRLLFLDRLIVIAFCVVVTVHFPKLAASEAEPQRSGTPSTVRLSELRATTQDEKARAKFFDKLSGPKDLVTSGATSSTTPTPEPPPPPGVRPRTYSEFMEAMACTSPTIVVGRVVSKTPHLNSNETSVFTDHEVAVEQWIQPAGGPKNLTPGKSTAIIVSLPGGRALLDTGVRLEVNHRGMPGLLPGETYILFLHSIPNAGASFELANPRTIHLNAGKAQMSDALRQIPGELSRGQVRAEVAVSDLRRALAACLPRAK